MRLSKPAFWITKDAVIYDTSSGFGWRHKTKWRLLNPARALPLNFNADTSSKRYHFLHYSTISNLRDYRLLDS